MRTLVARLAVLAILLSAPFALKAQDNASMTGVVTDSTGAVIPGATVVLTNSARGIRSEATTDKDADYVSWWSSYTFAFSSSDEELNSYKIGPV